MEITITYWSSVGIMEKKMETTVWGLESKGLGFKGLGGPVPRVEALRSQCLRVYGSELFGEA